MGRSSSTASDTPEPAYWAFISYSSHDRAWARWLQKAIETYVVPRRVVGRATAAGPAPRRLRPLFSDRTELAAAADLAAKVHEALDHSAFLIVICSPSATASRWVDEEIRYFRRAHGGARILAAIVAGDLAGGQGLFPPALHYRAEAGDVSGIEPIAADLRPGGDGRRLATLKLVAGMLGVGLDELAHRDGQRRQRRWAALAAGSLAGMALMTGLAGVALVSRNEAVRQRGEAEGLIGFMLKDLRKRLEPAGRLDLMDGIGPRALAYYNRQRPEDLDAKSLGQRADALRLMGEISLQRGHLAEALNAFDAASATTGEIMGRAPGDGQRVFDHAQSVFWVGSVAYQRGEWARAEGAFRNYLALAERLTAIDPRRDDWRMEVDYAAWDLGSLYLEEGRDPEATDAFVRSLNIGRDLARRHPADIDKALALGQSHAWLADALEKQGRLTAARDQRLEELAIYRALLVRNKTLHAAQFSTVVALRALARIAVLGGDTKAAIVGYANAATQAETLLQPQPDNMDLAGEAAAAEVDLGEALLAAGRLADAKGHQRRALALTVAGLARDPSVKDWQGYSARARLLGAAIAARQGDLARALASDTATLAALHSDPTGGVNTDGRWLLDRARVQTGDDFAAVGRNVEARARWTAAADDLSGPLDRYEPRLLVVLREADRRLGRQVGARAAAHRLATLLPAGGV